MPKVVIYANESCPYCTRARKLLTAKGVEYEMINIVEVEGARDEMIAKSGRKTIPQIFIGDHHVGGCDDLHAAEDAGELDKLLQA